MKADQDLVFYSYRGRLLEILTKFLCEAKVAQSCPCLRDPSCLTEGMRTPEGQTGPACAAFNQSAIIVFLWACSSLEGLQSHTGDQRRLHYECMCWAPQLHQRGTLKKKVTRAIVFFGPSQRSATFNTKTAIWSGLKQTKMRATVSLYR